nr:MAG TPA: Protein of unknown function (DUF3094) [Caudoviricetes sp.]
MKDQSPFVIDSSSIFLSQLGFYSIKSISIKRQLFTVVIKPFKTWFLFLWLIIA